MMQLISVFLNYKFKYNVIVGDFNFPEINWPLNALSSQGTAFLDFCQENFLLQHIMQPTRRASKAILDLVFTTGDTPVSDFQINEEFGSSDHSIINFHVDINAQYVKKKRFRRNLERANWDHFQQLITTYDWSSSLSNKDINESWGSTVNAIREALDTVAPLKNVPIRNFISSPKVRTSLRAKRRCFSILKSDPSPLNQLNYARSLSQVKGAVNEYIAKRENLVAANPDPKVFWSYVNRRLNNRMEINCVKVNDNVIDDNQTIANYFNEYFNSVFGVVSPIKSSINVSTTTNNSRTTINHVDVSISDVMKVLRSLPNKTSPDSDGLSYIILKKGGFPIASVLTKFFSLSMKLAKIPDSWKMALITPIHKSGSRTSVTNYRPISITSCCSRILERIVNRRILSYLNENNLLKESQHGFYPGKSTDTALLNFYDFVTESIDKGQIVDAVFFDYSKAFDSVPHPILLSRLEGCGVEGNLLLWIKSFLSNRSQSVKIGDTYSTWLPVPKGVIQGSVLGPTLFNVFINNIDDSISNCNILKYADDVRIYLASEKRDSLLLKEKIQSDISSLVKWSASSGMSFNAKKCQSISFGRSNSPKEYHIDGSRIPASPIFTDLGVRVNTSLDFQTHIDACVSKSFAKLGIINKVFKNKICLTRLYKAFVRPLMEYSCIVWNPYTRKGINKAESVQKRMCRMLPNVRHLPHYRDQLAFLGLMSMEARRLRYQLITMYKMYKGMTSLKLEDYFDRANLKKTRGHSCTLTHKFAKNNYRLNFFTISCVKYWNMLSEEDISAPSLSQFKRRLTLFFVRLNIW